MALSTAFTDLCSVEHPIVLAPMGGSAGGELAAAVSNAGGLGLIGGGYGDPGWLDPELDLVAARTDRPWGVGFLTWALEADDLRRALERHPHAVMLSFGDPAPFAGLVQSAGVPLILQVTDLREARQAIDLGADVIVAQGTEAGGHGGRGRGTLAFVPPVVDAAAPTPVLAAGGIADGRGLAAALALGAAGAVMGTRFQATPQSLVHPAVAAAIVEGRGDDTDRSTILDVARGSRWPRRYTARTVSNAFVDRWRGREDELAADPDARRRYEEAKDVGELPPQPAWAGEVIDLITGLADAGDIVRTVAAEAEEALDRAARRGNPLS